MGSQYRIYLYVGSFGDLFDIAAFLPALFDQDDSIILAADASYYNLLRIFIGVLSVRSHCIFFSEDSLQQKRKKIRHMRQHIQVHTPIFSSILADNYSEREAFNRSVYTRAQVYSSIFRQDRILTPSMPQHVTDADRQDASDLMSGAKLGKPSALLCVNTGTHINLTKEQYAQVIHDLQMHGIEVIVNTHGLSPLVIRFYSSIAKIIKVPAHLMSLIISSVNCIGGVIGGAIGIAYDYTDVNLVTIFTPDMHDLNRFTIKSPSLDCMGAELLPHSPDRMITIIDAVSPGKRLNEEIVAQFTNALIESSRQGERRI